MNSNEIKIKTFFLRSAEGLELGIRFKALPEEECARFEEVNYYCYDCL